MTATVKVSLLYNREAGGDTSLDRIRSALTLHGHDLVRVVTDRVNLPRLLDPPVDVVLSAGGDGTAAAAARALAGRTTPLAILPLGTANNIARSVGYVGSIEDLIGGLRYERRRPLDLGTASGPWGSRTFVESVGGGVIATGIATMRARRMTSREPPVVKLSRAVRGYHELLAEQEPRPCSLLVDGTKLDGEFLLVEVLNTRWIGPNFELSPDADPSDGRFTVVLARESDRQALCAYVRGRVLKRDCRLTLTTYRAQQIEIHGLRTVHVDDEVLGVPSGASVAISIEPAALELLEPGPTVDRSS